MSRFNAGHGTTRIIRGPRSLVSKHVQYRRDVKQESRYQTGKSRYVRKLANALLSPRIITSTYCILYFNAFMVVIPRGAGTMNQERTSGNIKRLQYDHGFKTTCDALFRADHTNLCTRVFQISDGKSSEVLGSRLVGGRDSNEWVGKSILRRAKCNVLGKVAKVVLVHLQRNDMNMYIKKHGLVRTGGPGCPCMGAPWTCPASGNTYAGFCCPGIIDQRRSDSRTVEVTDTKWLWPIVYALIGHWHVNVVQVLRWPGPSNTPDRRWYILSTAFRLAIGGSGRSLKDAINEHLTNGSRCSKPTQGWRGT